MIIQYRDPGTGGSGVDSTEGQRLVVPIAALGDCSDEQLPNEFALYSSRGCCSTWETDAMTTGIAKLNIADRSLRDCAYQLYQDVFDALRGQHLYRVWNYLPRINEGVGDSENYRQFCMGRSEAFHDKFGDDDGRFMPAGTCVGCQTNEMFVVALAGKVPPEHYENPNQIPAYRYPREYGPRSPSFARASAVVLGDHRYRFISGTAAVLGHKSIGIDDFDTQIRITCDNIECIAREALQSGVSQFGKNSVCQTSGKVYLRYREDYTRTKEYFENRFPKWRDNVIYLHSELCRQELLLEAEFTLVDQI